MDVCDCEMSVCLRGCLSLRSVRPSGKNQQLVIGQKVNTRVFMILKSTCMSVRSCNATSAFKSSICIAKIFHNFVKMNSAYIKFGKILQISSYSIDKLFFEVLLVFSVHYMVFLAIVQCFRQLYGPQTNQCS